MLYNLDPSPDMKGQGLADIRIDDQHQTTLQLHDLASLEKTIIGLYIHMFRKCGKLRIFGNDGVKQNCIHEEINS
jgi:hypothetical protein